MAIEFHVAPGGNDTNPGTAEKPFATLARARDAVRAARGDDLSKAARVLVRGGAYRLETAVEFGPQDGNCTVQADGGTPVFSGGRAIGGWQVGPDGRWRATIPDVAAGKWYFEEMFVGGQRRPRARHPDEGYFHVEKTGPDDRTSFTFKAGDLRPCSNLADCELVFLHDWSISRVRVASISAEKNEIRLAERIGGSAAQFRISNFEPHPRYFIENAPELLTAAGEWYLDRGTGVLTYIPMPGEKPEAVKAAAPVLTALVRVAGDWEKGRLVEGLQLVGLVFEHCRWPLPPRGYAGTQACWHEVRTVDDKTPWRGRMAAAVDFVAAKGCGFVDGRIEHVGGTAISFGRSCSGNRLVGSVIADAGGNGVMIGEPSRPAEQVARENVVANNVVRGCGRRFFGAVGVWAGITEKTIIRHNEISDLPYSGVSVGWQWNTEPTACGGNRVDANHIHHVMQILSDGGGIYTLGCQPGTVLWANLIHDVPRNAGRAESNGMFIDEGSSALVIENNTIYAVDRSPIRFHRAEGNIICGNQLVVAAGQKAFTFNACQESRMHFEPSNRELAPGADVSGTYAAGKAGLESAYRGLLGGK